MTEWKVRSFLDRHYPPRVVAYQATVEERDRKIELVFKERARQAGRRRTAIARAAAKGNHRVQCGVDGCTKWVVPHGLASHVVRVHGRHYWNEMKEARKKRPT